MTTRPKITLKSSIKQPTKSLVQQTTKEREELYQFCTKNFSGLDRSYMGDNDNPYDLPTTNWEEMEENDQFGEWESKILAYNKTKIMDEISDQEVQFLLQLKTMIEEKKIEYMDEENMATSMSPSYFIYSLKGRLLISAPR